MHYGGFKYPKDWNEFRDGKLIWRDMIRRDMDACILQSDDMEEFLDMLKEMGYEIKHCTYKYGTTGYNGNTDEFCNIFYSNEHTITILSHKRSFVLHLCKCQIFFRYSFL